MGISCRVVTGITFLCPLAFKEALSLGVCARSIDALAFALEVTYCGGLFDGQRHQQPLMIERLVEHQWVDIPVTAMG
ncbi:hypothetical protein, partial [Salmonella enterica]|uniref:hypothetical protein n=1 Tax=Salmonella enterica TaxID=28901 RepID=UPI0021B263F6